MNRVIQWAWASMLVVGVLATQRAGGQDSLGMSGPTPPTLHPVASAPKWNAKQAGWAGRVVTVEWDDGTGCEPCQYNAEAINGLMRRYPGTVFIPLSYHMRYDFFMSDPEEDILRRLWRWYGIGSACGPKDKQDLNGVCITGQIPEPDSLVHNDFTDGRSVASHTVADKVNNGGDYKTFSQDLYNAMAPAIDADLQKAPEAFFHAQTTVHGGQVKVKIKVDSITGRHPKLFLRLLLVQDTVIRYSRQPDGLSKEFEGLQKEQYNVVYASAHTPTLNLGLPLPGPGTINYTFDVAAIQSRMLAVRHGDNTSVQDKATWTKDELLHHAMDIPDDRDWRLHPSHIKVVAFVQDAESGEVLQTAMVPVDGKRLVLP